MSFMEREVYHGSFRVYDTRSGGIVSVPLEDADDSYYPADRLFNPPETVSGWFGRLSAPGYMDCTDWSGPFDTEAEADAYLVDTYGDDDDDEAEEDPDD